VTSGHGGVFPRACRSRGVSVGDGGCPGPAFVSSTAGSRALIDYGSLARLPSGPSAAAAPRALDHGRPTMGPLSNNRFVYLDSWPGFRCCSPVVCDLQHIRCACPILADGAGLRLDGGLLLDRPSPRSYAAVSVFVIWLARRLLSGTRSGKRGGPALRALGRRLAHKVFRSHPSVLLWCGFALVAAGARVLMLLAPCWTATAWAICRG